MIYGWTRKGGDKRFIYERNGEKVCVDMITTDRKHRGKGWSCGGQLDRWVMTLKRDNIKAAAYAVSHQAEPQGYTWPDPNRRGGRKRRWRK